MENEVKLTELKLDMLPSGNRKLVLENFVLLDDNIDSTEDLELDGIVPTQSFPIKLTFPLVMICTNGEMVLRINLEEVRIQKNEILTMVPGTIGEHISMSKDCRVAIMAIPEDAFPLLLKMENSLKFREHMNRPLKFHYTDGEMAHLVMLFRMMRSAIKLQLPYTKEILMNYMEAMTYFCITKFEKLADEDTKMSRGEILFHQFMDEVRRNYTKERQLGFYADKLCITSKYLSRIVKQYSNRQPSEWIRDYVVLESKALLRQNDLTVQQISDLLNFPNPSFFGKYFKGVVGCSPRQYQLQKSETALKQDE